MATIAAALAVWFNCQPFLFPLDDAYITLHNAQTLLTGHDANYGQPALVGTTSVIHLAVLALMAVALPPVLASFVVATIGAAAYLQGVVALACRLGVPAPLSAIVTALAALTGYTAYHLFNGLETSWTMAAVTWAIVFASDERQNRKLAVLAGLMPFLRPELGALSIALLGRQAWLRLRTKVDRGTALREIGIDAAVALVAALPWTIWPLLEIGQLLPGTVAAKKAFFAEGYVSGLQILMVMVMALAAGLGPSLVALAFVPRTSLSVALLTFAAILLAAFALEFPFGLMHNFYRYTYVLMPVCIWALCEFIRSKRRFLIGAILTASAVVAIAGAFHSFKAIVGGEDMVRDSFRMADWAEANLPAHATVLVHDAGAIAFGSNLRLIDLVGLKTPWATAFHEHLTSPTGGLRRGQAISEIAQKGGAQFAIILHDHDGFWGSIAQELRMQGWDVDLIHTRS